MLTYALKLTQTPGEMVEADVDAFPRRQPRYLPQDSKEEYGGVDLSFT